MICYKYMSQAAHIVMESGRVGLDCFSSTESAIEKHCVPILDQIPSSVGCHIPKAAPNASKKIKLSLSEFKDPCWCVVCGQPHYITQCVQITP